VTVVARLQLYCTVALPAARVRARVKAQWFGVARRVADHRMVITGMGTASEQRRRPTVRDVASRPSERSGRLGKRVQAMLTPTLNLRVCVKTPNINRFL
jgi:hypothetical protein